MSQIYQKIKNQLQKIKYIFKKTEDVFSLSMENELLREDNALLQDSLTHLEHKLSDPKLVIEKIFLKPIQWFDYRELSKEKQRSYYRDCQLILHSEAFNNIKNFLYATLTQNCVKNYDPTIDLNTVRDSQMSMNGIELLIEELNSIPDPDKESTTKESEDINQLLNY